MIWKTFFKNFKYNILNKYCLTEQQLIILYMQKLFNGGIYF